MRIEIPGPPKSFGCSKRVQRRVRESLPAVRVAFASIEILPEAIERSWGGLTPSMPEPPPGMGEGRDPAESPPTMADLVYHVGREIQTLAAAMVRADEALDAARRDRRQETNKRDDARRSLYRELGRFRKNAKGILGPQRARQVSVLHGETARDPRQLVQQTDDCLLWAASFAEPPQGAEDWQAMIRHLEPLRDDLSDALRSIDSASATVDMTLQRRDQAINNFDDRYLKGTRLLERFYLLLGLPSLAAAVRPHLKVNSRVGRPAKDPEPEAHPDLTARVFTRLQEESPADGSTKPTNGPPKGT